MTCEWYQDYTELHAFGVWLYEQGHLRTVGETLRYFEKPWHEELLHDEFVREREAIKATA